MSLASFSFDWRISAYVVCFGMLKRLTVWLDTSTLKALAKMGKDQDRPVGWLVRKIVEDHIEKQEKPKP